MNTHKIKQKLYCVIFARNTISYNICTRNRLLFFAKKQNFPIDFEPKQLQLKVPIASCAYREEKLLMHKKEDHACYIPPHIYARDMTWWYMHKLVSVKTYMTLACIIYTYIVHKTRGLLRIPTETTMFYFFKKFQKMFSLSCLKCAS